MRETCKSRAGATLAVALAALVAALAPPPASAYEVGASPMGTTTVVGSGPGTQTDPHVGGNLVSYTSIVNSSSEIRYHDLATGADTAVPKQAGQQDSLSDVSGSVIVFRRLDGSSTRRIMAFDTATGEPAVELDPGPGVRRGFPAIGGRTVAWQEFAPDTNSRADIVVYDLDAAVATRLTGDGALNREAAVSADGSTVAWSKCNGTGTSCDVYAATKAPDGWTGATPVQLTTDPGEEVLPDTNGEVVVYASRSAGDFDLRWVSPTGGAGGALVEGGNQHNPNISGSLASFEITEEGSSNADLWVLDLAADRLQQITDTPSIDETLNDISVIPDGSVNVSWAHNAGTETGTDVYAFSFPLSANQAPDCSAVTATPSSLWPPDRSLRPVRVSGATDPDGDPVTLAVTGVTQDEATSGLGRGDLSPDAQLGATPDEALLRAERAGDGDGRVYRVAVTATDPHGAHCSGLATVGVPRDQGDAAVAVDSGGTFDSLA